MAFFTELKTSLKQKWLQYFQVNHPWIARQMEVEYVATPDGGRRPSSYLILGVVSSLEPQLAELMVPFTQLNSDINTLIDVLDLNFDPERVQGNPSDFTANPRSINSDATMDALMGLMAEETPDDASRSPVEVVDKTAQFSSQQQSLAKPGTSQSQLGDMWLDELNQETNSQSEQTSDTNQIKQEKRSENDEISRLFPEF
jgi:hypothetical protein